MPASQLAILVGLMPGDVGDRVFVRPLGIDMLRKFYRKLAVGHLMASDEKSFEKNLFGRMRFSGAHFELPRWNLHHGTGIRLVR